MQKYFLLALVFLSTSIQALAQYSVTGAVTDSTGVSEPYATVRIYSSTNNEKPVKMGVTDINGHFRQELNAAGKYSIVITSVGKAPIKEEFELTKSSRSKDFGTMVINNDSNTLAGIEVLAQKPLVTTEIDRLSYDIKADNESKTSNIFEMLRKVPMVTIDGEDNILVNGSSNFKIYKNGRPNAGWSNNPKDVLKSIPASLIKRIEVITEPGAKYDAEGVNGILNIITDDSNAINGVAGTVSANANTNESYGASGYLTTQAGRFTTTVNYTYNNIGKSNINEYGCSDDTYVNTGNRHIASIRNSDVKGSFHYGNIETSYEIDTMNLVTLTFDGYLFNMHYSSTGAAKMLSPAGDIIYSYSTLGRTPKSKYFDFNGKVDYQHLTRNKGEAFTLSYLLSSTNQDNRSEESYQDLYNFPLSYDSKSTNNKLNFYEHTFQFDWTRPFAEKHKIEMGLKYILRQNFSETLYKYSNESVFTDFSHITHIGAVYGEYSFNSKRWGARAGMRYELAHLRGEYKNSDEPSFHSNIGDIVPTLSGSYKINDSNTLKLNFATRINRPGITFLNPAVSQSATTISRGNPNLKSTRRNSVRFSYTLMKPKITVNTSVDYAWANNMYSDYDYVIDGIKYSTYANNAKFRRIAWNLYAQWTATKSTTVVFNGTLRYNKFSNAQNLQNRGWGGNCYVNVSQNLFWKLKLNSNFFCFNSGVNNVYTQGSTYTSYGCNLSRSFLKEDRLTVKLGAQNPFSGKTIWSKSRTVQGDVLGTFSHNNWGRAFGINLSYRFGSLKASVKKTNKTITNEDLEGRK